MRSETAAASLVLLALASCGEPPPDRTIPAPAVPLVVARETGWYLLDGGPGRTWTTSYAWSRRATAPERPHDDSGAPAPPPPDPFPWDDVLLGEDAFAAGPPGQDDDGQIGTGPPGPNGGVTGDTGRGGAGPFDGGRNGGVTELPVRPDEPPTGAAPAGDPTVEAAPPAVEAPADERWIARPVAADEPPPDPLSIDGARRFELEIAAWDPGLHHLLEVELATAAPVDVTVAHRREGTRWVARATLEATAAPRTVRLPLDRWEPSGPAPDEISVEEMLRRTAIGPPPPGGAGPPPLTLAVTPTGGPSCDLEVHRVAVVSRYDPPAGAGLGLGHTERAGVSRPTLAAPLPVTLGLDLLPEPGETLHMRLLVAGRHARSTIRVSDAAGSLVPLSVTLSESDPPREVVLDLTPAAGLPVALRLAADGDRGALLVENAERRAREGSAADWPDVVLRVLDAARADQLVSWGHRRPTSPHLASVAAAGVRVDSVMSTSSRSVGAFASLMTGWPLARHGVDGTGRRAVPSGAVTLAEAMGALGYRTAAVVADDAFGRDAGCTAGFDAVFGPGAFPFDEDAVVADRTGRVEWGRIDARRVTSSALDVLARCEEPLFLVVATRDTSPPRPARPRLAEQLLDGTRPPPADDRRATTLLDYAVALRFVDGELARLDQGLERLGTADDTLLAVVSLRGEPLGAHDRWDHGTTLFEEELSVPWIVRWPARIPPGLVIEQPASLLDVPPTLVGLLERTPPAAWAGRDLSPWMVTPGWTLRAAPRPLAAELVDGGARLVAVRQGSLKLLARGRTGEPLRPHRLFDLATDPDEQRDLARDPDRRADVAALLEVARTLDARR